MKSKAQSPRSKVRRRNSKLQTSNSSEKLAIVALGANLDNARGQVLRAIDRLQELTSKPLRKSSLWETAPVDCPAGSPMFVNAVVALTPREGETPDSLLAKLHMIEK